REALHRGQAMVLPRVVRTPRRLVLHRVADLASDLVPGPYKAIPEPAPSCPEVRPDEVDWVLVPGLGFDLLGHRLGRGAGHYDRLLAELRPDVPRWALAYGTQFVTSLPIEPHDQPLDGILTASGPLVMPGRQAHAVGD